MTPAADARHRFTHALAQELSARAAADAQLLSFLTPIQAGLRDGFDDQPEAEPTEPPNHFGPAWDAYAGPESLRDPLAQLVPQLRWRPVVNAHPEVDPALQQGMYAAHTHGALGVLGTPDIRAGLFLLAPNIHYPLHTHVATELYFCVSGTLTLQHGVDGDPFPVTPGDYSITPTERTHALSTGAEPVMLIFAWVGEFAAPIYWWEPDEVGSWRRARWERSPAGVWERGDKTPVPTDLIARETLKPGT
jgi:quercetin dioxygenase-like cupin family protein